MKQILILMGLVCLFVSHATPINSIQNNLIVALQNDQKHRHELNQLKKHSNTNQLLIEKLQQAQSLLDESNQYLLEQVITELGHWPGIADVGAHAAKIGLILFKRADTALQARYLPLIQTAVENQDFPAK